MFDFDPNTAPESEAVQAEQEIVDEIVRNEMFAVVGEAVYDSKTDTLTTFAGDRQATDGCDGCGKVADLYHNEATGLAFCEACDMAADMPVTWKHLRNGGWGVVGPASVLVKGHNVPVTKRSGEVQQKRVTRVLWTGTDREGREISIATVSKAA